MKKLFVFFCCLLHVAGAGFAQGDSAVQDSSFSFACNASPDDVSIPWQTHAFTVQPDRRFDFKLSANRYCYVVIKAESRYADTCVLCITNTSLDTVCIYALSANNGKQLLYAGGNAVPYRTDHPYVWHTASLALTSEPNYYLIALKAAAQNVNTDYQILKPESFQRWYRSLDHLVYFYAGFVLFIGLIGLVGGTLFRRKALFIYTGYVFSLAGWILAHYGYLFAVVYPGLPRFNGIVKQVTSLASDLCLLQLITVSFAADIKKRWMQLGFLSLKVFAAALTVYYFLYFAGLAGSSIPMFVNVLWNVSLLVSVAFIITVLVRLFTANNTARLFCIAISMVSLMAVYQSLSNMGWLYNYFLNEHGMAVASLLEIILLTMGIFYNLWEEKRDKEKALMRAESERTQTLQMLIGVQEDERRRIASDLHDSIGPMLAAIKINFMRLAKAKADGKPIEDLGLKTEGIIDESIAEIRAVSHRLMPKGLSSKGLITLLNEYFKSLEETHNIRIHFTHDINVSLDKEVQLNLYRMISELSLNAAKHSAAEELCVSMRTTAYETVMEVKDNGTGFVKDTSNGSSLGLKNVQSRVEYLKGKMQLVSAPGRGTAVQIIIPHNESSELHQA